MTCEIQLQANKRLRGNDTTLRSEISWHVSNNLAGYYYLKVQLLIN